LEKLKQILEELEQTFSGKLQTLRVAKLSAFGFGLAGFVYMSYSMLMKLDRFKLDFSEFLAVEAGLFLAIFLTIALTPLYLFLSDKIQATYCLKIKTSIFSTVLDQYNVEYTFLLKNQLPDADIKALNFENNMLTFAAGDDFIFGRTADGIQFRIAEMHSSAYFRRKFDGLVGVRIYDDASESERAFAHFTLAAKEGMKVIRVEHKLYFLKPGDKKHFEFQFKGTRLNKEKLLQDYQYFEEFAEIMFGNNPF
jgi:hypothetical protein